jgi:hypothetical protein
MSEIVFKCEENVMTMFVTVGSTKILRVLEAKMTIFEDVSMIKKSFVRYNNDNPIENSGGFVVAHLSKRDVQNTMGTRGTPE